MWNLGHLGFHATQTFYLVRLLRGQARGGGLDYGHLTHRRCQFRVKFRAESAPPPGIFYYKGNCYILLFLLGGLDGCHLLKGTGCRVKMHGTKCKYMFTKHANCILTKTMFSILTNLGGSLYTLTPDRPPLAANFVIF